MEKTAIEEEKRIYALKRMEFFKTSNAMKYLYLSEVLEMSSWPIFGAHCYNTTPKGVIEFIHNWERQQDPEEIDYYTIDPRVDASVVGLCGDDIKLPEPKQRTIVAPSLEEIFKLLGVKQRFSLNHCKDHLCSDGRLCVGHNEGENVTEAPFDGHAMAKYYMKWREVLGQEEPRYFEKQ